MNPAAGGVGPRRYGGGRRPEPVPAPPGLGWIPAGSGRLPARPWLLSFRVPESRSGQRPGKGSDNEDQQEIKVAWHRGLAGGHPQQGQDSGAEAAELARPSTGWTDASHPVHGFRGLVVTPRRKPSASGPTLALEPSRSRVKIGSKTRERILRWAISDVISARWPAASRRRVWQRLPRLRPWRPRRRRA